MPKQPTPEEEALLRLIARSMERIADYFEGTPLSESVPTLRLLSTEEDSVPARSRRGFRRPIAAALLLIVLIAGAFSAAYAWPTSKMKPQHVSTTPTTWRAAGIIEQQAWTAGGSAFAQALITCPSPTACYSLAPGSAQGGTLVEVSRDGGRDWSSSHLPPGWRLTSALACLTTTSCVAGVIATAPLHQAGIVSTDNGGFSWSIWYLPIGMAELSNVAYPATTRVLGTPSPTTGTSSVVITRDQGHNWSSYPLPDPFVPDSPEGLACPTASNCVVVGSTAYSLDATAATAWSVTGGESWDTGKIPGGFHRVNAVTCTSRACIALANGPGKGGHPLGPSVSITTTTAGRTWHLGGTAAGSMTSLACTGSKHCWAGGMQLSVGDADLAGTFDGGATWHTAVLPSEMTADEERATGLTELVIQDISSISCPSPTACVAVGVLAAASGDVRVILRSTSG